MTHYARYFNTSGPNIIAQHYTLLRQGLVAKGLALVRGDRYFTIPSEDGTGKSTYFLLLKTVLEREGYSVMQTSMEKMMDATMSGLLRNLSLKLRDVAPNNLNLPEAVREQTESVDEANIRSWLVLYDEEKDF